MSLIKTELLRLESTPADLMHSTVKLLKPFNSIHDISPHQADLICSALGSALLNSKDNPEKYQELKELHEQFLLTLIQVLDRKNWTTNLPD